MVVARIVQGSAAAILPPQVFGSIRVLFQNERELARAMSAYAIMKGMGRDQPVQRRRADPVKSGRLGTAAIFQLLLPISAQRSVSPLSHP